MKGITTKYLQPNRNLEFKTDLKFVEKTYSQLLEKAPFGRLLQSGAEDLFSKTTWDNKLFLG